MLGHGLFSIGRIAAEDASFTVLAAEDGDDYYRFLVHDGRLVGAILLGDTSLAVRVQKAVDTRESFIGFASRPDGAPRFHRVAAHLVRRRAVGGESALIPGPAAAADSRHASCGRLAAGPQKKRNPRQWPALGPRGLEPGVGFTSRRAETSSPNDSVPPPLCRVRGSGGFSPNLLHGVDGLQTRGNLIRVDLDTARSSDDQIVVGRAEEAALRRTSFGGCQ